MAKKGFKGVNMLVLGGGLLLVVLFFLGAFAVKEGFQENSGFTVESTASYKNTDTSGETNAKIKINAGLDTRCKSMTDLISSSYNLGTITYSVESSNDKKTKLKGSTSCNWGR